MTYQETTKPRKKVVPAATLAPEIEARVLQLAEQREWSISKAAGHLIKLGVERLDEMQSAPQSADRARIAA